MPFAVLNVAPPRAQTRSAGLRDRARAQADRRATSDVSHSAASAGDALPHTYVHPQRSSGQPLSIRHIPVTLPDPA